MRITKKMLERATENIPMELAESLANRRWNRKYLPFTKGIKETINKGELFQEANFRAYAQRESGDPINLSLYIWLARAIQKICPERVDARSLNIFEKEVRDHGWLLG